ncbi:TNF receptor-associated factor 3-like [Corticium candelabrum]|uniref:TNF receptor-associated factor 3-like n=1 Tax=Corticium candelabrum TaxID=121492 RepID=UPI002E261CB6|nr:TNF receptor-associated factor 3-like [Corticium candelabrum]XP_062498843.1 TNF receptor-associated factor 3-like [Corticium candelabrum]
MADGEYKTGFAADFEPPLDKKHECPVCYFALRDPIQTSCGHRFCTDCINQILLLPRPKCPMDNELLKSDEIFPDNFCKREILSLNVRCHNKEKGCDWRGALKELEAHENSCIFTLIHCPNEGCQITVPVKDLTHHQQNECKFRLVPCPICGNSIVFSEQREHFSAICPDIEIDCENDCKMKVKRREMPEHLSEQCPNTKMPCGFGLLGCPFVGTKSQVQEHQSNEQLHHLQLMLTRLSEPGSATTAATSGADAERRRQSMVGSSTTTVAHSSSAQLTSATTTDVNSERLQNKIVALSAQMESLMSDIVDSNRQIHEKQDEIQTQKEQIQEMVDAVRHLQGTFDRLSHDISSCRREISVNNTRVEGFEQKQVAAQSKVAALEQQHVRIEKTLSVKDNALAEHDVRILSLEMTSYDGVLRWKVTDFNRRRSEAIAGRRLSIYSPPFFTSRSGYKMCARMYLNGDGMGKGTHLSLFFVVMKGEYDALLKWPFQQRVTFTLVDQEYSRHISDTFQPDPSSSSFQRPTSDMNVASGCPLFVPLDALETRGYIKDDTMFIRIAVDIQGLNLV